MRKSPGAVSIACSFGIGLLALAVASFCCSARAQPAHPAARAESAELVLCDRVAADPTDPDKPADVKGTADIAPSDVATAIKYCRVASAASAASRRALYQLGRAYAANRQLPEAVSTYRKAADKGSTSAMVELGVMLADGSGVAKDPAEARALFQRAAQAGNPRGAVNLAALSGSEGLPSDPAEARALLTKAAEANSAEAEFQLGLMYANGVGGPKDDVAARALFEKAAAQNHAAALEWAGSFAEGGRGGPKDKDVAKAYYERAVALGDDNAKAGLERIKCPMMLTDKKGNLFTRLCF
jgi:TPR repeat protein